MADANAVIRELGALVAQLAVDKAILNVELAEARALVTGLDVVALRPDGPENSEEK